MYYELYVDVLFLVNFMMDYLLLCLVKRMLKCTATHGRMLLGAALGSAMTCLVVVVPIPYAILKLIIFHMLVNTVMIRVGLKIKDRRTFLKAFFLLYIGAFLLGGLLGSIRPYVRMGSLFFAIAVVGYYVVSKLWDFLASLQRIQRYRCLVDLYLDENRYSVKGMIDTGNGLMEPISGKPVCVLNREAAKKIFGNRKLSQVFYIPYHSIGKKEGLMPAMKLDRMCVHMEEDFWISEPLIAVSEESISANGDCEMILNPSLF